jgi:hypothetical protein
MTSTDEMRRMSKEDLKNLDANTVAIINRVSSEKAQKLLPKVTGIPKYGEIYLIIAADGDFLGATIRRHAAHVLARRKGWTLVSIH